MRALAFAEASAAEARSSGLNAWTLVESKWLFAARKSPAFQALTPRSNARCALQNAGALGGLVLTTDALVVDDGPKGEEKQG